MRRLLLFAVVLFAFPLSSAAQIPHVALFGGYTWVRSDFNGINQPGFSLNGWDASLEVKPVPIVGLVADVSRQYASPGGINENQTMALFGPQVSVPGFKRVIPYAHAMAGFVHGTNGVLTSGTLFTGITTGNAFATAVGGGVDFKLGGPIWIRAIQADWLHANLDPDHRTRVRLATGIVIRFGK
jgi:hypothetical protein